MIKIKKVSKHCVFYSRNSIFEKMLSWRFRKRLQHSPSGSCFLNFGARFLVCATFIDLLLGKNDIRISTSDLSAGIYHVQVVSSKRSGLSKFSVARWGWLKKTKKAMVSTPGLLGIWSGLVTFLSELFCIWQELGQSRIGQRMLEKVKDGLQGTCGHIGA